MCPVAACFDLKAQLQAQSSQGPGPLFHTDERSATSTLQTNETERETNQDANGASRSGVAAPAARRAVDQGRPGTRELSIVATAQPDKTHPGREEKALGYFSGFHEVVIILP